MKNHTLRRKRFLIPALFVLASVSIIAVAADQPVLTVTGSQLTWDVTSANTVNVHRGDGTYITSLPGDVTSWTAPYNDTFFVVIAEGSDWNNWQKSNTVAVQSGGDTDNNVASDMAFANIRVNDRRISWDLTPAKSINVHKGDGSYIATLIGLVTSWLAPEQGSYYFVATNNGDWDTWQRSDVVMAGTQATTSNDVGTINDTSTDANEQSTVLVNGLTLSWPDDGWYQVQNSEDNRSVCEGGQFCSVDPGTYVVINHTTGQRHSNIVVNQPQQADGINAFELNDENLNTADVNSDNAVALIRQAFEIVNARAYDQRLYQAAPLSGIFFDPTISSASQQPGVASFGQFACSNGGTATQTVLFSGDVFDYDISYENCQIGGDIINGRVQRDNSRYGNFRLTFDDYRVTFEPDGLMTLNGEITKTIDTRAVAADQREGVGSNLNYLFDYPSGRLEVSDSNISYDYFVRTARDLDNSLRVNTVRSISPDSTFLMTPPFSDTTFRVTMNSEMSRVSDDPGFYFNFGQMQITSTNDNSSLILDADSGDVDTNLVTTQHRGQTDVTITHPWSIYADIFCLGPTSTGFVPPACRDLF